MLSTNQLIEALNEAISDEFVEEVFRQEVILPAEGDHFEVELGGKWVKIPTSAELNVLTKVLVVDCTVARSIGVYQVQLGIGKMACHDNGIVEVRYCFATLFFNAQKRLTTYDFHRTMS